MGGGTRAGGPNAANVAIGAILVILGLIFLASQTFGLDLGLDLGVVGWPLFVIVPGVVLLVGGLLARGWAGLGISVAGSIVTTVGLVLLYQATTDHWASWAYAWALVGPGASGLGLVLWGLVHGRGPQVRAGTAALVTGIALFLVGFAFFEGLLNLGGTRFGEVGRLALPIVLIGLGALILLGRLGPGRRGTDWGAAWDRDAWQIDDRSPQGGAALAQSGDSVLGERGREPRDAP